MPHGIYLCLVALPKAPKQFIVSYMYYTAPDDNEMTMNDNDNEIDLFRHQ